MARPSSADPAKPTRAPRPRKPKAAPAPVAVSATSAEPESRRRPPPRVVLTGGAGFVGRHVAEALRSSGHEVVALVRDPGRAPFLAELGVELVESDLTDDALLVDTLRGADGLIHAAGSYRVGIPKAERGAMWEANIGTTTRLLDAAEAAGIPRILYVSTVNVFGNTHGAVVDETYQRDLANGFVSWYDETKYGAHEVAVQRLKAGAPIVVVMPSQVYGPGDHSGFGEQIRLAAEGRLPYRAVDDVRLGLVHVEDLASGIVAALERGAIGETYVLSGPEASLREAMTLAASLNGRTIPKLYLPYPILRAMAPLGRFVGQPNLGEVISASQDVTYLASSAKAERELGFHARSLEDGFRDTFAARH